MIMKKQIVSQCIAALAGLAILSAGTARAADTFKADNNIDLKSGASWVGGATPSGRAVWDSTVATPANCTNAYSGTAFTAGVAIRNPSAPVDLGGSGIYWYLGGVSGVAIDMSQATVDLTLQMNVQPNNSSGLLFTNAAGRTLTFVKGVLPQTTTPLKFDGDGNFILKNGGCKNGAQTSSLTKNGAGMLTLSNRVEAPNITLNAGTVNLNHVNALNTTGISLNFTNNGGTLDNTAGKNIVLANTSVLYYWNGDFAFGGTTNLDLNTGAVTLSGSRQVTVNNNTLSVGGVIGGTGSLTKAGTGWLALYGASTYTGNTTISAGTLALTNGGSLSSSKILVGNGATFDVSASGWTGNGSQSLGGAGTSGTGTVNAGLQTITLTGTDGLYFQAAGGGSHTVGNVNVADASGNVYLNNNTVTVNVTGAALGVSTNTLLTVAGTLNGSANPAPNFTGLALSNACGAAVITISGSPSSLVLIVTNIPAVGENTTTSVARTTGTNPEIYGGQLNFTATVSGTATSPTGNVIFKDGATILATVALTPGASPASAAIYTEYTDLKVAGSPHSIAAYYQGDGTHNLSDSSGSPVAQTITAKSLMVSGNTAGSTTYDGTTTAKLGGAPALSAAEASGTGSTADGIPYTVDSVSLSGTATGTLAAKDVGLQAVTITGMSLTGADVGNYSVLQQTGLVQTVTVKALTVVGLTATNKVYDGTTAAGFTTNLPALQATEAAGAGTTIDGKPYTGDAVSLTGTPVGTFASSNIAVSVAVNVTGLSLTGASTNNYSLTAPTPYASITGPLGDQIRADNGYTLNQGAAWVSGSFPDSAHWAIWTGTYAPTNCTSSLGSGNAWGGICISNVANGGVPITITNGSVSVSGLPNGGGGIGIDMSAATVDLIISGITIVTNQTWTAQSGRSLTSPTGLTIGRQTLTLSGAGDYYFFGSPGALYGQDATHGVLVKSGAGTVTLSTPNYVPFTTLNGGTLNLNHAFAVNGYGGSTLTINGGTLDNTTGGAIALWSGTLNIHWNGDFAFGGTQPLSLGNNPVTLGGNRQVTVNAGTLTVAGVIGDGGSGYSLTKAGSGTLTLSGANTYKGNTTVNAGTLDISQATLATNSTITVEVAAGALLQLGFAVTNTVTSLVLDGIAQPAGVYGTVNSTPGFAGTGSLLVLGSTTPTPTNITYTVSGSALTLNWPAGQGWNLQSNSVSLASSNDWHTATGATPPYPITINPANPEVFYRLTYP